MHPYRDPATADPAAERRGLDREELVLYGVLVAVGGIPVVIALVGHARFAAAATLGLVMLCAGALGVMGRLRRRGWW